MRPWLSISSYFLNAVRFLGGFTNSTLYIKFILLSIIDLKNIVVIINDVITIVCALVVQRLISTQHNIWIFAASMISFVQLQKVAHLVLGNKVSSGV